MTSLKQLSEIGLEQSSEFLYQLHVIGFKYLPEGSVIGFKYLPEGSLFLWIVHRSFTIVTFPVCLLGCEMQLHFN